MTYAVVLRFDPAGACLRILHDDSETATRRRRRSYRLVAQTDDQGEAVAVADLLRRRINAGEVP